MAQSRPKKRQRKLDAAPSTTEVVDDSYKKVYIVLERACLETIKTKKVICPVCMPEHMNSHLVPMRKCSLKQSLLTNQGYQLLNCDEHMPLLRKMKRDPQNVRPDIVHQALMTLLDSPLNKTGCLQIYVHTTKNVLIEISPHIRIPRTFRRFCGLMGNSEFVRRMHARRNHDSIHTCIHSTTFTQNENSGSWSFNHTA